MMNIKLLCLLSIWFACWPDGYQGKYGNVDIPPSHSNSHLKAMEKCKESDKKLDIAFVLDCTGSMDRTNQAVTEKIKFLMDQLKTKTNAEVRKAVITYTDMAVGTTGRFHILPFDNDPQQVITHIKKFCIEFSEKYLGNMPEDVTGALNKANKLPWEAANRVIFHITDAPGHHLKFGTSDFPNGKQGDPQPEEFLKEMNYKSIHYVLGEVKPDATAKMVEFFKNYTSNELGNQFMIETVNIEDTSEITEKILETSVELINKNCEKKSALTATMATKLMATTPIIRRPEQYMTRIVRNHVTPGPIVNINDIKINI